MQDNEIINSYTNNNPSKYNSADVIEVLNITQSKLRFWCQTFNEFIDSEYYDNFSELDLIVLKRIEKLIQQEKKSTKEVKLDLHKNIVVFRKNLNQNQSMQLFQSDSQQHMEFIIKNVSDNIFHRITNYIQDQSQQIVAQNQRMIQEEIQKAIVNLSQVQRENIDNISKTVSNAIKDSQEKLQAGLNDINDIVNKNEFKSSERDLEISNLLKENLMLKREMYEKKLESQKGFIKKLFKYFKK